MIKSELTITTTQQIHQMLYQCFVWGTSLQLPPFERVDDIISVFTIYFLIYLKSQPKFSATTE